MMNDARDTNSGVAELPVATAGASRERPSTRVVGGIGAPLDEGADSAAVNALPFEARGEVPTAEALRALDLGCSATTAHTYQKHLRRYVTWCAKHGLRSFPAHPEMLAVFFGVLARARLWATIHVSRAAISAAHVALGYALPKSAALHATVQALRSSVACIDPIPTTTLRAVIERCSADVLATRDRAIILLLHFGRLSPRQISALHREHVVRRESSYFLRPAPSRTSAASVPAPIELRRQLDDALCPVSALDAWLSERAGCVLPPDATAARGPLFVTLRGGPGFPLVGGSGLGPRGVTRVLKKRAAGAGLDPSGVCALEFRAQDSTPRSGA